MRQVRETLAASGLRLPTAHDSYLINLASPDDALHRRSVDAFTTELRRAEQFGLSCLGMTRRVDHGLRPPDPGRGVYANACRP